MLNILKLYGNVSLWVKFHNLIRWKTCPFEKVSEFVPKNGRVLELGCGFGLMSNLLAFESHERDVLGIDVSPEKILVAKTTLNNRRNIRFEVSDIFNPALFKSARYNCIIIVDVLYLIPLEKWKIIFENCYHALMTGGILLVKEQGTKPGWKYLWNRAQEFLSVKVFKITHGETFTFPPEETVKEFLNNAGFSAELIKLDKGYLRPHILFVCRK